MGGNEVGVGVDQWWKSVGILLRGLDRAEGLGKAPFKDPPVWTCLDLSFGGSGTSRGMSI